MIKLSVINRALSFESRREFKLKFKFLQLGMQLINYRCPILQLEFMNHLTSCVTQLILFAVSKISNFTNIIYFVTSMSIYIDIFHKFDEYSV